MTQTQYDRMAEALEAERARTDKLLQMLEMQQAMTADLVEQLHDLQQEQKRSLPPFNQVRPV